MHVLANKRSLLLALYTAWPPRPRYKRQRKCIILQLHTRKSTAKLGTSGAHKAGMIILPVWFNIHHRCSALVGCQDSRSCCLRGFSYHESPASSSSSMRSSCIASLFILEETLRPCSFSSSCGGRAEEAKSTVSAMRIPTLILLEITPARTAHAAKDTC